MKIKLENITKRYPSRDKKVKEPVVAVDSFNLEIEDGELVCLLGPSGCGKSTVLNMISGLADPTEGKIFFGDEDVTKVLCEKRGVGLVFQNYALYPHLTALQNITFPLENLKGDKKMTKEQMKAAALEAAKLVQIEPYLERRPSQMSGGQQQRVAIARALVKNPGVLLLDEPLSNLDARLRIQTREEIRRIQRETGVTTVFVTHDQDEAMSISDRIAVMEKGRLIQAGKPQKVYEDPTNLFVAKFLGTPQINVFDGEVKNGKIYIGSDAILDVSECGDGKVTVCIRPEGFIPKKDGRLACRLLRYEEMGRDTSVIASHEGFTGDVFRAIIDSDDAPGEGDETVCFDVKPKKVFLFDKENGKRIPFRAL